jgi:uncharacterized protein YbjT (DUF2867 family)
MANRAVILGSTGLVGGHVLTLTCADAAYTNVLTLGRRDMPRAHEKHMHRVVDFSKSETLKDAFGTHDDVYCCLGTTIKTAGSRSAFRAVDYDYPRLAAELAKAAGTTQFLLVSALGANPYSSMFYNRVKGEVEQALTALQLESLSIFRPSLLLGERQEFRLGERLVSGPMRAVAKLMLGPLRKYRGIDAKDVARAMLNVAKRHEPGTHVYESDRIAELANAKLSGV